VSNADLLTYRTKMYKGGMGGRFMYLLLGTKSTEAYLYSVRYL
jgi:hypothetical protein